MHKSTKKFCIIRKNGKVSYDKRNRHSVAVLVTMIHKMLLYFHQALFSTKEQYLSIPFVYSKERKLTTFYFRSVSNKLCFAYFCKGLRVLVTL